jgi:uncharacterized membrane protein YoaK (UPF0700 family)
MGGETFRMPATAAPLRIEREQENPATHSENNPAKIAVAIMLTLAAGVIDATGFLLFLHVFTAHMTGNTVHLGIFLVQREWMEAAKAGLVIPVFLAGSLVGRIVVEYGARKHWKRAASLVFLLEAAALTEVIWTTLRSSESPVWSSLFLLSFAMGLQTAALTRIGPLTVHTTFVTGMLNSLGQRISNVLFWTFDTLSSRRKLHSLRQTRAFRETLLLSSVWIAYVLGAAVGASLALRFHSSALLLPLGILFTAVVIDQLSPLSIAEEEEEAAHESDLRKELKEAGG